MKKQTQVVVAIILGFTAFVGAIFIYSNQQGSEVASLVVAEKTETKEPEEVMLKEASPAPVMTYRFNGDLKDVSGGKSTGVAKSNFEDGSYSLVATFENLPEPTGTDFYEGWIVRQGDNFNVISTGAAAVINGQYRNEYGLDQDLTDHSFYVLTLEPDDGDPAPADHILEGTMSEL
ncbi:MAG: hypothetical protein HN846_01760 [Candidatus Pacebacteria bacterium]|jgi:hypothetical protein|nr:hypothetical protein [Candidatus Paceibacterota bacterium]